MVSVVPGSYFDYERTSQYNITIQITDTSGLTMASVLTVQVQDVNEVPVLIGFPVDVYVSENSLGNVNLTLIEATDPEDHLNFQLSGFAPPWVDISSEGGYLHFTHYLPV